MGILSKKSRTVHVPEYDREKETPAVRCSICTGEMVAGFKDIETGHFREFGLIRDREELEAFRISCGVSSVPKVY